jgi:hypothetical protein
MAFNNMTQYFGRWTEDEHISTKMSSLSMDNIPEYISSYFTKWSANIAEYVSTMNDIQICASDITIQHMASFYGSREGKGNLDKDKLSEHCAHMSKALSGKVFTTEHCAKISKGKSNIPCCVNKWNDTLAARRNDTLKSLKSFIVIKGRMPKQKAAADD